MIKGMNLKIGTVLSAQLKEKRISVRELSKLSGVPASTLGEWINNRAPKNPVQAQRVAAVLGVSLHYFFFGEEDRQEPLQKIIGEDFFKGVFEISIKRVQVKD